jgi:hypothetical protein
MREFYDTLIADVESRELKADLEQGRGRKPPASGPLA